ncbi:urease accessory protein UreF [Kallotenue papyrolyticum]|uniref:urease accessory protein UreF n=1 Tax=Kallotenue papyrolyticum TaxID=1325125 RepID=UPI00047854AD|nr:urease accessory UreF family protein [Kallotenue papyrolyticum]
MLHDALNAADGAIRLLQLLHLADSALPIGGQAHSFGLETLTATGLVTPLNLETALDDYLEETGAVDAIFCRGGYRLAEGLPGATFADGWYRLNATRAALQPARESREASTALARRFLSLAQELTGHHLLAQALDVVRQQAIPLQHATTVGLVGGALSLGEDATVLAYLQQSMAALASAAQRLLPVGQHQMAAILWRLKPRMAALAQASRTAHWQQGGFTSFAPLLEVAGMRHPRLSVRLFIS